MWVVIVCMCTLAAKFVAEIAVLERRHPVHATPTVAPTPSTRYHEYRDRRTAPTVEMVTATAKVVPASNKTEEDVLILVLSRRPAFETRTTIRETWGKGCTNIRFVVGSCCRLPQSTVQPWTCIPHAPRSASQQEVDRRTADCFEEDRQLERERNQFNDMVFARTVDVYRHLPQKLKEGYQWAMQNSLAEWIIKTDDDSVVRVKALTKYLRTTLDASVPTVYGSISKGWGVHRAGKWAERTYAPSTYPAFPLGSHGHVVSRPVAQWIADNQHGLINYQGEDVSIGIWLDGSPLKSKIKWVASKHTANHGNCFDPSLWMIGHDISAAKMRKCFGAAVKSVQQQANVNIVRAAPFNRTALERVEVNPQSLRLKHRFDIVVKAVYAAFAVLEGPVPRFVTAMYDRHLKVWNNFQEQCVFKGDDDWFDSQKPCVKKNTAADFRRSFYATIRSIRSNGMDPSISLVPVTKTGFPLNGAHRIAAALALGKSSMPIQRAKQQHTFEWDYTFFRRQGMESKYTDFAMLEWTLRFPTTTVVVWPRATAMSSKMATTRTLVSDEIGEILYEKTLLVSMKGLETLVFHAYGEQTWLSKKVNDLVGAETVLHICVLFVNTPNFSLQRAKVAKERIRAHYGIDKSSIHVSDGPQEAALIAEMVLNLNSVMYLNKHEGSGCSIVSNEIATRLNLEPLMPSLYSLPLTIMIDSGAVMSFFGLRPRTDVDVLFWGEAIHQVLGLRNRMSVEPHTFTTTNRGSGKWKWGKRNWGNEHLEGLSVAELFYNPSNYGYCHGLKFVSLSQLVRYKTNRGERGKDDRDVALIVNFMSHVVQPSPITRRALLQLTERNNVWVCPTAWYTTLANALFDRTVLILHPTSRPSKFDIFVHGVGEPPCSNFFGTTLIVNGESANTLPISHHRQTYFIGPYPESPRSMPVYNVARWYTFLRGIYPNYFDALSMPRRLPNSGIHFMIYLARNCVPFRDEAYLRINKLANEAVHLGGACPKKKTVARVVVPPRSKRHENPRLFSKYRFILCMENAKRPGYVTEKLLSALISGAIPVYYGSTDVFKLFNKNAFIYYDIHNPQPALDRIRYLEMNLTAYAEVVARPILANGEQTLEEYFSLSDDVGGGKLKQRIRDMVVGSGAPESHTKLQYGEAKSISICGNRTLQPTVVHFLAFQKGGTTSLNTMLPKPKTKRFPYRNSATPNPDVPFYLNEVGWGASYARTSNQNLVTRVAWIMRDPIQRAWSEWRYRSDGIHEPTSFAKALPTDDWQTYTARHAEHHTRHVGPAAVACYCSKNTNGGCCQTTVYGKALFDCLFDRTNVHLDANANATLGALSTFAGVGTLERIDEAMVLFWRAGLLSGIVNQPCALGHSNQRKGEKSAPEYAVAWIKQHNPRDLAIYAATEIEFERRLRGAEQDPVLLHWLVRAREGKLNRCPGA